MQYFESYAHADSSIEIKLMALLQEYLAISSDFDFVCWNDRAVLPGEDWRAEIDAALAACDFGLLLVSPAFLGSRFIIEVEMKKLLADKRVIPVALRRVAFDGSMKLHGLYRLQIFHDSHGRSFDECATSKARRDFVWELFTALVARLKKAA